MLKIIGISVGIYGFLMVSTRVFEKQITFWNKPLPLNFQYSFKYPFHELWLRPDDVSVLNTLYFTVDSSTRKGLVLYFHGNADNLARWGKYAPDFTKNGYEVLMIDYPNFGKSTGEMTEEAFHAHARYVYKYAKDSLGYTDSKIILYGRSLGTGVATQLATVTTPKYLILETPYLSLPAVGKSHLPILPYEWLKKLKFHTDRNITQINCPVHLFHGTSDELVPYNHSLKLCEILKKEPSQMLTTIEGGKHKNLREFKAYRQALDSLLLLGH